MHAVTLYTTRHFAPWCVAFVDNKQDNKLESGRPKVLAATALSELLKATNLTDVSASGRNYKQDGPRLGICIVGQLSRLELKTKVERLIKPSLPLWGGRVDVVMVLDPMSERYVNTDSANRETLSAEESRLVSSQQKGHKCKRAISSKAKVVDSVPHSLQGDAKSVSAALAQLSIGLCAVTPGRAVGHSIAKSQVTIF
jgi:hypothetical protein